MQHPQFKKDPWATIRLHASNAIVAKDAAGADQGKKAKLSGMEGVD